MSKRKRKASGRPRRSSEEYAVFILTHGRPDNVKTYHTIRKLGYTGRIVLVVDDMDKTIDEYRETYGDEVVVFDKMAAAEITDACDNIGDMRCVVFARNAVYDIAKSLGLDYFVVLDDDYIRFDYRFDDKPNWIPSAARVDDLDAVFGAFIDFMRTTSAHCVTMAQGGDYIGGYSFEHANKNCDHIRLLRKAMNVWFLATDRRIEFAGRINEDTSAYTLWGSRGQQFFTHNMVSVTQTTTQKSEGGLTEIYLSLGTYVKSFYSVMMHPSGTTVQMMRSRTHQRLHHQVAWNKTVPKIIRQNVRKRNGTTD
jgi:hypothetical protein